MFTVLGGYHGDTFAPMSVTDPVGGMHTLFTGVLPEQVFAAAAPGRRGPPDDDPAMVAWERATRALYAEHAAEVAAVVVEPVLQGAGGMHAYSPYVVRVLAALAREHGALVIFDEIATGFGRTGTLWAADRCGVVPDIMTVGQGPHRRLPHPRGDAVHRRGRRGRQRRPLRRADARPDVHGQPAGLLDRAGQPGPAGEERRPGADRGPAGRADHRPGAGARARVGRGRARPRRGRRHPAARAGHAPPRSPPRRSSAASGCARSATSSTRCRRTSPASDDLATLCGALVGAVAEVHG